MAESRYGEIYWHSPDPRAVFILDNLKTPRSMKQLLSKNIFSISVNTCFDEVINQCAARENTWINDEIIEVYSELHRLGFAHSVETFKDGILVGGLYGIAIGGAFFGESMFNLESNASKAAFYYLTSRLKSHGFELLDSQYINDFTEQLGAVEYDRAEYMKMLEKALPKTVYFL